MTHEDAVKWLGNLKNDIGNPHYECLWHYAQALDEIAEILEKQEAVAPELEVLTTIDRIYRCPKCHKCFFYKKQKYCDQCGQAVKWDG